jgi:hypothetical protein
LLFSGSFELNFSRYIKWIVNGIPKNDIPVISVTLTVQGRDSLSSEGLSNRTAHTWSSRPRLR